MSERRKIMELFENQKEYTEEKIQKGIEENRKGYMNITLKDEKGNVIPGAKIRLKQKSHEFKFGANLFMLDEMETDEKNALYKEYFADVFNIATLPFYWDSTEPEEGKTRYDEDSVKLYRRPAIDKCIRFCEENGIEPREHALAYEHFFPEWLKDKSVFEIKKAYTRRCREISERYKDKIPTIEVTNEMEWFNGTTAIYKEPDFIEWAFKTAEKYFPANQLVINEHTILAWADRCLPWDKYYAYIDSTILKGARVDGIGMQFHMFFPQEKEYEHTRPYYNPENLYNHMDLYSNFGKPLQVTEVTIPAYSNDAEDEALQAEIIEKLYSIWFSHPNMEQIVYWNLVDGYCHVADPSKIKGSQGNMKLGENVFFGGLIRFDMTPKPAYHALKNLICNVWHTDEKCVSDENGVVKSKGFYGKYDVEITVNGKTVTKEINHLKKASGKFVVTL